MKNNKYEIDMCNGTLMDKLISFSLPLMLSGILQLLFNAVDIIVVGRFTGSQALAAVGSTTARSIFLPICLLGSLWVRTFWQHVFMLLAKRKKCQRQYIHLLPWH